MSSARRLISRSTCRISASALPCPMWSTSSWPNTTRSSPNAPELPDAFSTASISPHSVHNDHRPPARALPHLALQVLGDEFEVREFTRSLGSIESKELFVEWVRVAGIGPVGHLADGGQSMAHRFTAQPDVSTV